MTTIDLAKTWPHVYGPLVTFQAGPEHGDSQIAVQEIHDHAVWGGAICDPSNVPGPGETSSTDDLLALTSTGRALLRDRTTLSADDLDAETRSLIEQTPRGRNLLRDRHPA